MTYSNPKMKKIKSPSRKKGRVESYSLKNLYGETIFKCRTKQGAQAICSSIARGDYDELKVHIPEAKEVIVNPAAFKMIAKNKDYTQETEMEIKDYGQSKNQSKRLSYLESLIKEQQNVDELIARANTMKGQYLNCRLFVQLVLKSPELEKIPIVKSMKPGDLLQFGEKPARHWAIYIGDGNVLEVAEWGAEPQTNKLSSVIHEYDEPIIRRKE
jgi:hypothetical protein